LAVETWEKQDANSPTLANGPNAPVENQNRNQDPQALVKDRPTRVKDESSNLMSLVNVYDWKTGRRIVQFHRRVNGSLPGTAPLDFSEDGKYIVSLTELGGTIYAIPGLERVAQFMGPFYGKTPRIRGDMVALPEANRIRLWSLRRREDIALLDEPDDASPFAFTPDGNWLLTAGGEHAFLYRLTTPEKLELPHHAGAVAGVEFSPDGRRLASVGKDRVIRVCDTLTGRMLWETNDLPGLGQCVSYSPDGKWLAAGVWDKDLITIRDAHTGRWVLELGTGRTGSTTYCVQFSPDGRHLAVGADVTRVWAVSGSNEDTNFTNWHGETNGTFKAKLLTSWDGIALCPIFSPDSRWLAFCNCFDEHVLPPEHWGDSDRPLYLWDFSHSAEPRPIASRILGLIECERFTPDSRQLLAMDVSGDILTLEVPTGKRIAAFHANEPQFDPLALGIIPSPDGSKIAVTITPPSGGAVSILDPKSGRRLYSLPAETGIIYWLAWSPDSRRLAVARDNGKIAIWDLEAVHQILAQLGLKP
jgi:WD40 repeat protein